MGFTTPHLRHCLTFKDRLHRPHIHFQRPFGTHRPRLLCGHHAVNRPLCVTPPISTNQNGYRQPVHPLRCAGTITQSVIVPAAPVPA